MDIYLPPGEDDLPEGLAKLPRTSWSVPSGYTEQHIQGITDWNVSTVVNSTFHDGYHTIEEVKSFMDKLVATFPDTAQLTGFGQTAEGREMYALTISSGPYKSRVYEQDEELPEDLKSRKKKKKQKTRPPLKTSEKLGIVIMGAQHAREVRSRVSYVIVMEPTNFYISG